MGGEFVKMLPLTPDDPMPDLEERLAAIRALGPMEFDPGERPLADVASFFADHQRAKAMNKTNAIFLAAGLFVGLLVGGLTAALWDARYNVIESQYTSDFIMRLSDRLSSCQQQNNDLQKKVHELEQREKDRP